MISQIVTITKTVDSDPWVLMDTKYRGDLFTQEQVLNALSPYSSFIRSLPGFISLDTNLVDNTYTFSVTFDKQENLDNYNIKAFDNNNPIVKAKNDVVVEKMKQLNITPYKFSVKVVTS